MSEISWTTQRMQRIKGKKSVSKEKPSEGVSSTLGASRFIIWYSITREAIDMANEMVFCQKRIDSFVRKP